MSAVAKWLGALVLLVGGGVAGYFLHTTKAATPATTSTVQLTGCARDQSNTYVQLLSITPSTSGGATISVHPVDLHCGGPDDRQYLPLLDTETWTVAPGATFTILNQSQNFASIPATLAQVQAYLIADPDNNIFQSKGSLDAVTSLDAVFHP